MFVVVTYEIIHRMPSCRHIMFLHFHFTIIIACHASAYLKNQRISTQIRDNHLDSVEEVSTHPVHFVHKADPGHSIFVSLQAHKLHGLKPRRHDRAQKGRDTGATYVKWVSSSTCEQDQFVSTPVHLNARGCTFLHGVVHSSTMAQQHYGILSWKTSASVQNSRWHTYGVGT